MIDTYKVVSIRLNPQAVPVESVIIFKTKPVIDKVTEIEIVAIITEI